MNVHIQPFSEADAILEDMFHARAQTEQPAVQTLRREAFQRIANQRIPNRKIETWKYTDLRASLKTPFPMAVAPSKGVEEAVDALAAVFSNLQCARFTITNGHLAEASSDVDHLPSGVTAMSLQDALAGGDSFLSSSFHVTHSRTDILAALNTAYMTDGVVIQIAPGVQLEEPIHLRFLDAGSDPFSSISRIVVQVEEGASASIIESHENFGVFGYQSNTMVEVVLKDRAKVTHVRVANGRDASPSLSTLTAALGAQASFSSINISAHAPIGRHQVYVEFKGEHSMSFVGGVTMLQGKEHYDVTLTVDHAVPNCVSRELFKTAVDGSATGVFQGKIAVRKDAQKTDGKMMSAALLLSDDATMNSKPELEIFADDVVCGHGATCGQLDDELLFYLMARGLPRPQAEAVMVEAFLGEVVEMIPAENVRETVQDFVSGWLKARRAPELKEKDAQL